MYPLAHEPHARSRGGRHAWLSPRIGRHRGLESELRRAGIGLLYVATRERQRQRRFGGGQGDPIRSRHVTITVQITATITQRSEKHASHIASLQPRPSSTERKGRTSEQALILIILPLACHAPPLPPRVSNVSLSVVDPSPPPLKQSIHPHTRALVPNLPLAALSPAAQRAHTYGILLTHCPTRRNNLVPPTTSTPPPTPHTHQPNAIPPPTSFSSPQSSLRVTRALFLSATRTRSFSFSLFPLSPSIARVCLSVWCASKLSCTSASASAHLHRRGCVATLPSRTSARLPRKHDRDQDCTSILIILAIHLPRSRAANYLRPPHGVIMPPSNSPNPSHTQTHKQTYITHTTLLLGSGGCRWRGQVSSHHHLRLERLGTRVRSNHWYVRLSLPPSLPAQSQSQSQSSLPPSSHDSCVFVRVIFLCVCALSFCFLLCSASR